jgi:hypothetical protein
MAIGVWRLGTAFVMQGNSEILKRGFRPEATLHMSSL